MVLLARTQLGPGTIPSPAVAVPAGTRKVLLELDLAAEEPSTVWSYVIEWSFDGGANWAHAVSGGGEGILRSGRGGAWPQLQLYITEQVPTHIRGALSLSERISIGLNGFLS